MSTNAQAVLDAFDHLLSVDRDRVILELLRRVRNSDHTAFSDEELVSAADAVFTSYDAEEADR